MKVAARKRWTSATPVVVESLGLDPGLHHRHVCFRSLNSRNPAVFITLEIRYQDLVLVWRFSGKICAPVMFNANGISVARCVNLKSFLSSVHNNISEPHNWNANWWIKCLKGGKSRGPVENKKPIEEWRRTTLFQEGQTRLPTTPWLSLGDGSFVRALQTYLWGHAHTHVQSADKW